MAHKTMVDGTSYEITGGKTLVDGTAYSIKSGKTLVDGTAYGIEFGGWPDDLDTGLEFLSENSFTLASVNHAWDGTMEYCNSQEGWKIWNGGKIYSGETERGQCIYIRGTGNTTITNGNLYNRFVLGGAGIFCDGNIENILDYATVAAGKHPTMAELCFFSLFKGETELKSAPSLPATTLAEHCYDSMFYGCTELTSLPSLPATTLAKYCYRYMFQNCTKIKLSTDKTGAYTTAYRIPFSGTGTDANYTMDNMFYGTGGTFAGTPTINTTYYLDSSNTIV